MSGLARITMSDRSVPVTVCVLTYNAEDELTPCLESIAGWARAVFIVDSHSTDSTREIAQRYTDQIGTHAFEGFASQRNWALDTLPWPTEWVLFLDQDERLTPQAREEIRERLRNDAPGVGGFYIKRRFIFMGRWLRHGGYYPNAEIRLFRRTGARVIDAGLREYLKLDGTIAWLRHDMLHDSGKGLGWWIAKHNMYADVEAEEQITRAGARRLETAATSGHLEGPRQRRNRSYWDRLPLLIRPLLLFTYRYVVKFGFLDGMPGFVYCFLHDLWYPFLVDAKVMERRILSHDGASGA